MDLETPLRPLLSGLGLDLYDLELAGGTLSVTVTRPGGVDLDALTEASRAVSAWLDANDPIPGRYTLDVSSPGLERRLRTPGALRQRARRGRHAARAARRRADAAPRGRRARRRRGERDDRRRERRA